MMRHARRYPAIAAAVLAFGASAGEHARDHAMAPADANARSAFQRDMQAGMTRMMKDMHAPGYTDNPDIDFLAMMIPHHEGAVEMARLLLIHGNDPATRRLAEDIIASQQVEIEGMRRRLQQLRTAAGAPAAESFPALGGTRGRVPAR